MSSNAAAFECIVTVNVNQADDPQDGGMITFQGVRDTLDQENGFGYAELALTTLKNEPLEAFPRTRDEKLTKQYKLVLTEISAPTKKAGKKTRKTKKS